MAKKPVTTPSGELEHPAAGGSYRRRPDGSLELVQRTEPVAPEEPETPPAALPVGEG